MDDFDVYSIPGFYEPVSCLSHLFAAPFFAVLGYFLVRRGRGETGRCVSLGVMAFSTVFLLSMSSVYHLLGPGSGRYVMRQLDVAAIFALIAGSATPVHAILFRGVFRWAPLVLAWGVAATGITLRSVYPEGLPSGGGTAIFLLMGWAGLITCVALWRRYGFAFIRPVLWSGLAYTLGALLLGFGWPSVIPRIVGPHEMWHLAVLIGLGFHWQFVFQFAGGLPNETVPIEGDAEEMLPAGECLVSADVES